MACVSVASNIDPEQNIDAALGLLANAVRVEAVSRFFITPAIDRPEQPDYYNGAVRLRCACTARALKFDVLRPIEAALGRERGADRCAPRSIDLDLLLYEDAVIDEPDLVVPDPDLATRPFLAAALLEVAGDMALPGSGRRLEEFAPEPARRALRVSEAFTLRMRSKYTAAP